MVFTGQTDTEGFPLQFDNDISEEERRFYLKLFPSVDLVKDKKTHCTSCNIHLGTSLSHSDNVYMHPILKVSQCKRCNEFYNSGEFSKGEDGSELYCRWCGQGGEVYCCAKCPFVFCKACISINLAKSLVADIRDNENWNCFVCSPKITWPIRATHWALKNYIEKQKRSIKNPNLSETEKKRLFKKDSSTCCARRKVGEESDSSNDSDIPLSKKKNSVKRKRTESSTSSVEEPKIKLPMRPTTPKIASVTSTSVNNKQLVFKPTQNAPEISTPPIVTAANLIQPQKTPQQFLINNNITVQLDNRNLNVIGQSPRPVQNFRTQNSNNIQGGQSAVKIVQLPQQNGPTPQQRIQIQLPGQQSAPPPLLIRNRAVQIRPHVSVASPPQNINQNQNRTTTTTVQLGIRQTSENAPVYHNIGGFCIDLNSAAQHDSIRLPNGKLIQVKKSTTNNPSSTTPSIRQQIPSGYLQPIQNQPQHQFTITQTSGMLPPMPAPNTTVSFPTSQPIQHQQSQNIQTVPASTIIPNAAGQVQIINGNLIQTIPANIANQPKPLLVRNVFPNTQIGKARTQLQNQLFSAMEICQHLINKLHTLTNSNPYKNANSLGDVKELYIHLSYLFTYGIGRLKNMQEKVVEDMTSMGFKTNVFNLAKGQPTTEKYSSDGDEDDIEIVEPKTTTINLDSDPEDSEEIISQNIIKNNKLAEKTENITKNKVDNDISQKQNMRKILPKPGIRLMTPAPWPKTHILKPKLPILQPIQQQIRPKLQNQPQLVNQQQKKSHNQQIESINQEIKSNNQQPIMMITNDEEFSPLSVLAGMLEIELTEGESAIKPPEPKKPRKKVTTRPNPNLIKKKELCKDLKIEKLKTTDLKLRQRCTVNITFIDKESEDFTEALKRFENYNSSSLIKGISTVFNKKNSDIADNSKKDENIINDEESKSKMKCTKPTNSYQTIESNEKEKCVINTEDEIDTSKIKFTQNCNQQEKNHEESKIPTDGSKSKENSEFFKSNENSKINVNEINPQSSKTQSEKVFEEIVLYSDTKKNEKDSSLKSKKQDDNQNEKFKNGNEIICMQTSTSRIVINDKLITDNVIESKQQCHIEKSKILKIDKNEKCDVKVNFTQICSNQSQQNVVTDNIQKNNNECSLESVKLNEATKNIFETGDDSIICTRTFHNQSEKEDMVYVNTEKTENDHNEDSKILNDEKKNIDKVNVDKISLPQDSAKEFEKNCEEGLVSDKTEKPQDGYSQEFKKLNNNKKESSEADNGEISCTQICTNQFEKDNNIDNAEKTKNDQNYVSEKLIDGQKEKVNKADTEKTNFTQSMLNQSERIDKELMDNESEKLEKLNDNEKENLKENGSKIGCKQHFANQCNKNNTELLVTENNGKKKDNHSQELDKLSIRKNEESKPIEDQISITSQLEKGDNFTCSAEKTKETQNDESEKLINDEKKKVYEADTENVNVISNSSNYFGKIKNLSEKFEKSTFNENEKLEESENKIEKDGYNQESKKLCDDKSKKCKVIEDKIICTNFSSTQTKQEDMVFTESENLSDIPKEIIDSTKKTSPSSNEKKDEINDLQLLQSLSTTKEETTKYLRKNSTESNINSFQNEIDVLSEVQVTRKEDITEIAKCENLKKSDLSPPFEETEINIDMKVNIIQSEFSKRLNSINILRESVEEKNIESESTSEDNKKKIDPDILVSANELNTSKENLKTECESIFSNRTSATNEKYNSNQETTSSTKTRESSLVENEIKIDSDNSVSTNKLNALKENFKNDNHENLKTECGSTCSNRNSTINEKYNSNQETTSNKIKNFGSTSEENDSDISISANKLDTITENLKTECESTSSNSSNRSSAMNEKYSSKQETTSSNTKKSPNLERNKDFK